jgi:hypothetical protein
MTLVLPSEDVDFASIKEALVARDVAKVVSAKELYLRLDPNSELSQSITAALTQHEQAGQATETFT